jgi:class 3 adenylate cyclase/pimeloyl-ACP methyl ester carboxylesterase
MTEVERRLAAIMFTDLVGYTALMGADERRAIDVVERSRELIRARVAAHGGRCLEHEGDGTLSVFASAVEAASCALEIQSEAARAEIGLHIGVHLGDVIDSGERVVGDGVNVAARICKLGEPGQVFVSEAVFDQVRNQRGMTAQRVGAPELKNVGRPIQVWSMRVGAESPSATPARVGRWRRVARVSLAVAAALTLTALGFGGERIKGAAVKVLVSSGLLGLLQPHLDRSIAFTRSADGTRIAWASVGSGPPIVQVQIWWTNVEYGPLVPIARAKEFTERHRIVYYDGRGFGLSQRDVKHSPDGRLQDLEAVIDAAHLDRFVLWGISSGTPVAIRYAAAHPERVSKLILYGTVLSLPVDQETYTATLALLGKHYGSTEPAYREYFHGLFFPDASDFEVRVFAEYSASLGGNGGNAAAVWEDGAREDVRDVARQLRVPTLVMHRRDDSLVPFAMGVEAAGLIPGARFEALAGRNHVFLPLEAEGSRMMDLIESFVDAPPAAPEPAANEPG